MRRRALLGGMAVAGAAAAGYGGVLLGRRVEAGTLVRSRAPLPPPFTRHLPVPAVLTPGRSPDYPDADYYEVTQREALVPILPGTRTRIWGFDGTFPGPTIVSRAGRRTVVRYTNRLAVPTVTHLHGGHTPPDSDGFPTDLVLPVGMPPAMPGMDPMTPSDPAASIATGTRDMVYPMGQRAATLWYHDHRMGFTGLSVWRGLLGMHLIRDEREDALGLPGGAHEVPLILTDRAFEADGGFRYPALDPDGMRPGVTGAYGGGVLGDVILVNGAPWPVLDVDRALYRLRVVNGSNARRYGLLLDPPAAGDRAGLVQIGSDGGLLGSPVPHESIEVAPGERFDVLVDFSRWPAGRELTLRNTLDSGPTGRIMRFRIRDTAPAPARIPDRLAAIRTPDPTRAGVHRTLRFGRDGTQWTINGRGFDPRRPLFTTRLGEVEVWDIVTDAHHPVHVHLNQFQVVSRGTGRPGPYDAGWKDTLDLAPAEAARIVLRCTDYAGRYLVHCHNLEHEDMAMMATFSTV